MRLPFDSRQLHLHVVEQPVKPLQVRYVKMPPSLRDVERLDFQNPGPYPWLLCEDRSVPVAAVGGLVMEMPLATLGAVVQLGCYHWLRMLLQVAGRQMERMEKVGRWFLRGAVVHVNEKLLKQMTVLHAMMDLMVAIPLKSRCHLYLMIDLPQESA